MQTAAAAANAGFNADILVPGSYRTKKKKKKRKVGIPRAAGVTIQVKVALSSPQRHAV